MVSYPGSIYDPRTKENDPDVEYDPEETTKIFAEDVSKLDDEVVAIQTELGTDPKGDFDTVKKRLEASPNLKQTIDGTWYKEVVFNIPDALIVDIFIYKIWHQVENAVLLLQFSDDGGDTWYEDYYKWIRRQHYTDGSTGHGYSNRDSAIRIAELKTVHSWSRGECITVRISKPYTNYTTELEWRGTRGKYLGNYSYFHGMGAESYKHQINAVRFIASLTDEDDYSFSHFGAILTALPSA